MQPRYIERKETLTQTWVYNSGGGSTTGIPGQVQQLDVLRNIESFAGDFRRPNPQHFELIREDRWKGTGIWTVDGALSMTETGSRGYMPSKLPESDLRDHLYNRCLSDTYDQIRGGIDLAVEVAQAGQTIGMVRGATKVVDFARDLVLSVRSRRPRGLVDRFVHGTGIRFDRTKSVASLWLEYQYGWRPAVQTVFDCVDALMKPARGDSWPLLVLKSRAKERELVDLTRGSNIKVVSSFDYFNEHLRGSMEQRGELMTQWRIPPSRLLDLAKWSSFNPASVTWELLPYSFVVDWFVDVGGYLRDLESAFLYQSSFVRGYFTHTRKYDMHHNVSEERRNGIQSTIGVYEAHLYNVEKRRSTLDGAFPKAPTFRPKLGWQRLVSAAGLLAGFLGRK